MQDICANGQTQSHAFGFCGNEWMEESCPLLGGDAGTVVGDFNYDTPVGGIAGAELDPAVTFLGFKSLKSVDNQIDKNLSDSAAIGVDGVLGRPQLHGE